MGLEVGVFFFTVTYNKSLEEFLLSVSMTFILVALNIPISKVEILLLGNIVLCSLKKKYQKVKLLSGSSCHAEKRVSTLMKRLIFITKEKAAGCCDTIWQERQHLKPEDSLNFQYLLAFYPSVVNGTLSSLIKIGPKGLRSQESRFGSLHLIKNCIHSK